jgi:hypothetical protein
MCPRLQWGAGLAQGGQKTIHSKSQEPDLNVTLLFSTGYRTIERDLYLQRIRKSETFFLPTMLVASGQLIIDSIRRFGIFPQNFFKPFWPPRGVLPEAAAFNRKTGGCLYPAGLMDCLRNGIAKMQDITPEEPERWFVLLSPTASILFLFMPFKPTDRYGY